MTDCTLVVMAAGMGSRYGGLKQLEGIGPSGELLAEYAVYDALRAGFTRVVYVIKEETLADFQALVSSRFAHAMPVFFACQRPDDVPAGCRPHPGRTKPLGTAHAVYCCRREVDGPFAVINADDFYGASAFTLLHDHLVAHADGAAPHPYCMAAYALRSTVSPHGSVSRGVCQVDTAGFLQSVVERTRIERRDGALCAVEDDALLPLADDAPVSMNAWGFYPSVFSHIEAALRAFLNPDNPNLETAECYLPTVVGRLLAARQATVRVLMAHDHWIGITYPEDRAHAAAQIASLVAQGRYPASLWAGGQWR
ncbi:MAG: nucleotidyltransferase [Oscillospiraceae bacterium]|jgi:hypothetical protein|nr:nucleotidyltransferase [Oscillospiraceae bacterium]